LRFSVTTVEFSDESVDGRSRAFEHNRIPLYLEQGVGVHEDGEQLERSLTRVPLGAQFTCLIGAMNTRLKRGDISIEGGL